MQMPLLPTSALYHDNRLLQRAHHVLAFLVHFYAHSMPETNGPKRIPRSLTLPLMAVSQKLRIAPVLTYADTVLWNWALIDPNGPMKTSNMRCQTLFTRLKDE